MGMSASQARLLTLTARMSDLEFQAQNMSNAKIRLSDLSTAASQEYLDALDKEKITVNNGSGTYVDATAYNLTTYGAVSELDKQRFLKDSSGRILVTESIAEAYEAYLDAETTDIPTDTTASGIATVEQLQAIYPTLEDFLRAMLGYANESEASTGVDSEGNALTFDQVDYTTGELVEDIAVTVTSPEYDAEMLAYYTNVYTGAEAFLNELGYTSNPAEDSEGSGGTGYTNDTGAVDYYEEVFAQMDACGYYAPGDEYMKDSEWLYEQLNNGNIYLWTDDDNNGEFENVSWSSGDTTLATESDETEIAKAEAEYEVTMAEIESKDSRYDLELTSIDTEHSALQTEYDSVKNIVDKNIERTFKLFDA